MSRTTHPKETTTTNSVAVPSEVQSFLDTITKVAGPVLALTSKDRKRSTKLRKGGEKIVPTILALSDRIGLSVPKYPTAAIQANLDKVKTLSPIQEGVVSAQKHLDDTLFQAHSEIWEGATMHYTMLKRLAKTDGDVANALAPATEFFAHKAPAVVKAEDAKRGHRKGAKESKDSEATTAATTETTSAQAPAARTSPAPARAVAPNGAAHS